jgi:predicted HicB family RNase H-like nuclease
MNAMEQKTETLNLRVSPKVKTALQAAARREHRSMANMVEHLVLGYCQEHGLVTKRETDGVANDSHHT